MRSTYQFLLIMLLLVACGPMAEEVVEETWPDGSAKTIRYYSLESQDSILVKEISFYESGNKRMEGEFIDGRRNGMWKYWYENGELWSEGYFQEGVRSGPVRTYHPNGERNTIGTYDNGVRIGKWKFWDEKGQLTKEINYDSKD